MHVIQVLPVLLRTQFDLCIPARHRTLLSAGRGEAVRSSTGKPHYSAPMHLHKCAIQCCEVEEPKCSAKVRRAARLAGRR